MAKDPNSVNKFFIITIAWCCVVSMLFQLSCKRELSCEGCGAKDNKPPIAIAGPDQVITLPTDSVLLDGRQSSDPDGMISSYLWTKISGPASLNIVKPSDSITKVKTLEAGTYLFELKVTDNAGLSARDTLRVTVDSVLTTNHPPIANAGSDQTITLPTNTITLNGSGSTDPDNNVSSHVWTKVSGPSSFSIVNSNVVQTQLTNLVQGTYQLELKVTDAGGLFSKDTMQVIVNTTPTNPCAGNRPIINAQLVPFGILSEGDGHVAVASAGNKVLFAGGWNLSSTVTIGEATSRVDIYDIVTHNWSTAELSVARINMGVAVSGNKIFFAGGYDTDGAAFLWKYNNVDIYDASTNTWSVDSLSSARSGVAGAAVGSKIFFAGGGWPLSNVVDVYDLATNSWSASALSEARERMSGVAASNRIYFAGGQHFNSSNRIDVYDNATASWSVSSLIEPKSGMASIVFGNKIYWAGGITNFGPASSQHSNVVEIKDLVTNTSSQACLFQPNSNFSAVSKNDKIIFFTGTGAVKNKFDIYDPATNIWSIGVLSENITGAIISVNNVIYVVDGNRIWKLEF